VAIATPLDLPPVIASGDLPQAQAAGPVRVPGVPADQFTLFQLLGSSATQPIADLHAAAPILEGSDDKPDAQVKIELISFQIAPSEDLDPEMQATLRLDMGKDRSSSSQLEALFWSVAAGLDLAAQAVSKDPKEKSADLSQSFRRRPIEIPGALGELRVELVAHKPPPWWRRIFSFADNKAVRTLVSAVGVPGIALDAVKLLDEAISRFEEASAKPIFQSRPLTVAMTAKAATDFSGGLDTVKAAVLNDGMFVLLRHRDADIVRATPPIFLSGFGRLVPRKAWDGEKLIVQADDAYRDLSYAVLRVRTREVQLDQRF
jgi:hypothetical protein